MKTITLLYKNKKTGESHIPSNFFPRIIREFEDGSNEQPMMYGDL